ncbi:DUF2550 domain-containing protein [Isoptericola sp. NEAU-Y5]|uniref:DUF2550 domain-containing protein n=1 Tax=Isoptericola luteus TaxID=2879484 RepID=A0ABS7ZFL7_9MICO|nr:DUF2550 domain-containing protein [Isoptericola sp. NEAU-Y5]MCA5893822.1 DUF2550 domain-containing protein [Isoptericola sp. NEAU-Y5]
MSYVVWAAVAVVVVLALVLAAGASRLRTLSRRVGSFPCQARPADDPRAPWVVGIAHYAVGRIDWWRGWSLAPRPARVWQRERLILTGRVPLDQAGQADAVLVRCRYDDTDFELLVSSGAYAGLASWLESSPPGRRDLVV